jgi:hypothetical protein
MKDALEVFFEIILALTGAVAFATLIVGGALLALGCAVFGSCWGFLGWRKRRSERRPKGD